MDLGLSACSQRCLDVDACVARARRVLIFNAWADVAVVLGRAVGRGEPSVSTECFDDEFLLVDAFRRHPESLVLIGYGRDNEAGPAAMSLLLRVFPHAPVVAYGSKGCAAELIDAMSRGARGIMLWAPADAAVGYCNDLEAIRAESPKLGRGAALSEDQIQILSQVALGRTDSEIAVSLAITQACVKAHLRAIFHRLGARDRAHAVALAMRCGYLSGLCGSTAIYRLRF